MNNIFQKNITALSTKNMQLADALIKHIPTAVPQLLQENGFYNIKYRNMFVHNPSNPLAEAKEIFNGAVNEPVAIHVIYGLGLGYLFQVASLNSQGTVILYEPDLNILKISFTLVDFSNDILKQNVYITSDFEELSRFIYEKSGMKNTPQMLSLPSQREFNPESFDKLVENLINIVGAYSLDLKYTKEKFYPALEKIVENIPKLVSETPLVYLKDILKGKTALIVSAGPTLDRNIEIIKRNRDKVVIFTVGTAVKTLYKNGIIPDFLSIIETYDSSKQLTDLDLSNVNFITEPYSHPNIRNFNFKQTFSHISANMPVNLFWSETCNENIEEYWSKGTVSYTALNCARLLGCSKIILVGQDLAYIEGQCYSKDSAYKELLCQKNSDTGKWEITAKDFDAFADAISNHPEKHEREAAATRRLAALNSSLHYVKGINGDMIPTESVYAAFVTPLEEYVAHFNDREYINTSLVGAQINGFKNMSLEEALTGVESVGEYDLTTDFSYNISEIADKLIIEKDKLLSAKSIIEEGQRYAKTLNTELKRCRCVNVEVLKALKKLSVNYLSLSSEFVEHSKLFDFIQLGDKIDLDYEMKMVKEFNLENVTKITSTITSYYENVSQRIDAIAQGINNGVEKIR